MKKNSEEFNQIFVASFLKKLQLLGHDFLFWSTPNGGYRTKQEAGKMKLMGVLAGVPDMAFMAKNKLFFIEFKIKSGKPSPAQKEFMRKSDEYGHTCYVVYGDTPQSYVEQMSLIIRRELDIDQNDISKCAVSALSGIASKE